jgi:hypothetical protein
VSRSLLELTLDRANWKFVFTAINILMLGIAHQGSESVKDCSPDEFGAAVGMGEVGEIISVANGSVRVSIG